MDLKYTLYILRHQIFRYANENTLQTIDEMKIDVNEGYLNIFSFT